MTHSPVSVGILLFDDVEELDAVGPWEVRSWWAARSPLSPTVRTFSRDGLGIRCAKGLRILPDCSEEELGPVHVLVHPGGRGARRLANDPDHLSWVRVRRATVPLMTSVCTGALVYAAAGLLAGRPATTHRDAFDELALLDPTALLDTEARFVDDGDVITSAGVSAGIDMALQIVRRLESPVAAEQVRAGIQYEP